MASEKILDSKKAIVSEIVDKIKNSEYVIIFQYQGLTVSELSDLRRKLKPTDAEVKVYKNTLLKRALDEVKVNLDEFLEGPNAILFGKVSFDAKKLAENLDFIIKSIVKAKPSTVKGQFISNISVSSTMGPGIKIDKNSVEI